MFEDDTMNDDYLEHHGTPHYMNTPHSGRHPWNPALHGLDKAYYDAKKDGMSDDEFRKARKMNTTEWRAFRGIWQEDERSYMINQCLKYKAKGWSTTAIAERLFHDKKKESTVRNYLRDDALKRATKYRELTEKLKEEIKEKGCIDVGDGVEREMNVSKEALNTALKTLAYEGYVVSNIRVAQLTGNGSNKTTMKFVGNKDLNIADLYKDPTLIKSSNIYSPDGGEDIKTIESPSSVSSKRVMINYAETGGIDKDGVIEIRRGVKDLTLGGKSYAQVRIAVDDTHYLKGMAVYSDAKDWPKGVDIMFNTNKKEGTPMLSNDPDAKQVLKMMKDDPENRFGATIKCQNYYDDPNGKFENKLTGQKQSLSPVNIIKSEGDWNDYSRTLSSQFLSKQKKELVQRQLELTYAKKYEEYAEISRLTQSTVKQKMLMDFAEQCDSSAVDLKATALPNQSTKVILPLTNLKDGECYCPSLKQGTKVALVRYPHAGKFEIPVLTVNNNNKQGDKMITSKSIDAIGVNSATAEQLSGADFDGDTAMVLPMSTKVQIDHSPRLKELETFATSMYEGEVRKVTKTDKKTGKQIEEVKYYYNGHEYKPMDSKTKQIQMGVVSNLITDMTVQGAPEEHIVRAVKHSMVVIDAEKHKLDYKQSEADNNIRQLKELYQINPDNPNRHGASSLISRAGHEEQIAERKKSYKPNPETGEWEYTNRNRVYYSIKEGSKKITVYPDSKNGGYYYNKRNSDGTKTRIEVDPDRVSSNIGMEKVELMRLTKDAHELESSYHDPREVLYANYANQMKALANTCRKEAMAIETYQVSKTASETYRPEVESLKAKLERSYLNAPKERAATRIASQVAEAKIKADPSLDNEHIKRIKQQELAKARLSVGANKKDVQIEITPREWEAIQANALPSTTLKDILKNTDMDAVRKYATPRSEGSSSKLSAAQKSSIKSMINSGYKLADIAEQYGVSVSTISAINNGKE